MLDRIMTPISVIVPVFNEELNITKNLELLVTELKDVFDTFEIIVISDGSTDGTNFEIIKLRYPDLKLLIHEKNLGKGAAVRAGFERASGQLIFFIDGGMEIHPSQLRIFAGLQKLYGADLVIGSKRHPQSQVDYPLLRKLLSRIFQLLVKIFFKVNVTDTQVGIKLLRREVVKSILPELQIDRYGFDLEIISLAHQHGYFKILEAPIRIDYFQKNSRPFYLEFGHIIKVGFSLLKDTISLYLRISRLKEKRNQKESSDRKNLHEK